MMLSSRQSLQQQIVGSWLLVSNVSTHQDGTRANTYGPNPKGVLIYQAGGYFALVITRSDLPLLRSENRDLVTFEEARAVVQGSIAYYGTYTVDESTRAVIVRIECSTFANQIGTNQKRIIASLTHDELKFTNPTALGGATLELVWKRAK